MMQYLKIILTTTRRYVRPANCGTNLIVEIVEIFRHKDVNISHDFQHV